MSHVATNATDRAHIRRKPLPVSKSTPLTDGTEEPEPLNTNIWHDPGTPQNTSLRSPSTKQDKAESLAQTSPTRFSRLYHDTWLQEAFGTVVGTICFILFVWILHHFDKRTLRSWPLEITIGAVISILVTIMDAALTLPLSSAFGQLKWILVNGRKQTLRTMQQVDTASRSASGSINLLLSLQGGVIGSMGAIVAILMLAVGPFAQQVLKYSDQQTFVTQASLNRAVSVIENSAQAGSYTVATLPMRAAIYNALLGYSTNGNLLDPPFTCQTGNCTWDPFISIGICSECNDITNLLTSTLMDAGQGDATLLWSLPSEYNNASVVGWIEQGSHPYSTLNISAMEDWGWGPPPNGSFLHFAAVQNSLSNATEATALNCTLSFCLNQIDANMTSGRLTENITEVPGTWAYTSSYENGSAANDMLLMPNKPDSNHTSFLVNSWAPSALWHTLTPLINGTSQTSPDGGMMYDSDILMAFWTSRADIPDLMKYLASSMSTHLRDDSSDGSVPVTGGSYKTEPYIEVRWAWLALPAAVVVLVPTFTLVLAVMSKRTKTVLWKNSMLALLLHGLDDASWARIDVDEVDIGSVAGMSKVADDIGVSLVTSKVDQSVRLTER